MQRKSLKVIQHVNHISNGFEPGGPMLSFLLKHFFLFFFFLEDVNPIEKLEELCSPVNRLPYPLHFSLFIYRHHLLLPNCPEMGWDICDT